MPKISDLKSSNFQIKHNTKNKNFWDLINPQNDDHTPTPNSQKAKPKLKVSGTESGTKSKVSGTESGTKLKVSGTESGTKSKVSGTESGTKPKGISQKVLEFFMKNLQTKKPPITKKLNIRFVSDTLGYPLNSIQQVIKRLKKKQYITTHKYISGYYGYTSFEISKNMHKILKNSSLYNNSNSINTIITRKEKISKNKILSSFDGKIENNANSDNIKSNSFPEEWEKIDISPLKEEGFSKKHLIELYKVGEISPEIVQHSINHFAWGVKNNPDYYEKYQNKIFVLMGKLRKGGVWTESNYESPQEIALKELLEEKKRQQAKQEKLISDLMELEFPEWEKGLTLQQKKEINPYHSTFDRIASSVALKHYFKKEILMPRLREEGVIKQGNYKKTKV